MSLQGTLDTFALTDVLALLAGTKKRGELRVTGNTLSGSVWLDGGQLVGAEVPRSPTLVDAVFELLRLEEGAFSFEQDSPPRIPMPPQSVGDVLADAEERIIEWRDIASVVPSLNVVVMLTPDPPGPTITLDVAQWRMLTGVADGRPLADVAHQFLLGEFEACRTVKQLVEMGLGTVHAAPARGAAAAAPAAAAAAAPAAAPPPAPAAPPQAPPAQQAPPPQAPPAQPAPAPAQQAPAPAQAAPPQAPPAQQPAPAQAPPAQPAPAQAPPAAPVADPAAAAQGDEQVDRGALLKFLSSVRN